jgi:diaminohydroxyphosphoribosylaminopyrimidine deaminase / 5-amino-6-(5-phosphoribosylamino)uracil reductase
MSLHSQTDDDKRWMRAALALAERGIGLTAPNPSVGCIIVKAGIVLGRGWTQAGGRPHAEALALAQAGAAAEGATLYTTLEPCAHQSPRGPDCTGTIISAGVAKVVSAMADPDPRTHSLGHARLRAVGIKQVEGVCSAEAGALNLGFLTRQKLGRPAVTLKLAMSLDGCLARANGQSHWITGDIARAHGHLERARHNAIMVGRGTFEADKPKLDVRLAGLEDRSPRRIILSNSLPNGLAGPPAEILQQLGSEGLLAVMLEGGAAVAASFLAADLVDRLLCYRAPVLVGGGLHVGDIGLGNLADAHGKWLGCDTRTLGVDQLDVYVRNRKG